MSWFSKIFGSRKTKAASLELDEIVAEYQAKNERVREAGSVDGKHYTQYPDHIRQLKREKRYKEAIELLQKLVDATEAESKVAEWGVAPWYYEQLAIIYRKEKEYEKEVAILERYDNQVKAPGAKSSKLALRLEQAHQLAAKNLP